MSLHSNAQKKLYTEEILCFLEGELCFLSFLFTPDKKELRWVVYVTEEQKENICGICVAVCLYIAFTVLLIVHK